MTDKQKTYLVLPHFNAGLLSPDNLSRNGAGRRYVAAYVEYAHYVEKFQQDADGPVAHHKEPAEKSSVKSHAH